MIDRYNKVLPVLRVMVGMLAIGVVVAMMLWLIDGAAIGMQWMLHHPLQATITFFILSFLIISTTAIFSFTNRSK